ncbi:MAG: TatD family hydrolase [Spirochaetia bacterium]|jgi:TatD DNase family protein|nr:TatD family hydrolase [Spirochaetia bacterium]
MILSDFHCHLYGYDKGKSMDSILTRFTDEFPGKGKENSSLSAGRKENFARSAHESGAGIKPGMIFNNIRERDLWESGARFSLGEWPSGGRESGAAVVSFIGIHPWDFEQADDELFAALEQIAFESGAFIGEIGLDRLRLDSAGREVQQTVFRKALDIALKTEKPFTIHCVREWGALISILESVRKRILAPFIVHAYSGSDETMEKIISLGGYISFGTLFSHSREGLFSDKASGCLLKIDRRFLLLETDWTWHPGGDASEPDASEPDAYRNELLSVYEKTANLLKIDITELCGVIEENGAVFKAYTAYRGR